IPAQAAEVKGFFGGKYAISFAHDAPGAARLAPPSHGRLLLAQAAADADPARRGALSARRGGAGEKALSRGARAVPQGRRAPPELVVRAARALPDRRGVLSRAGFRQGREGVRGV